MVIQQLAALGLGAKRIAEGFGQPPASSRVGSGENAIQKIESGQRFVTDIELRTLAEVLGVSVDELLK